ncbi:MAG: FAD-binding oxidoreductase, partial [Promethearchaeota archaeon]
LINHLRNSFPWSKFFSAMERQGFKKCTSIIVPEISKKNNSSEFFQAGYIMLVDNLIQSGAIRDISHLYLATRVIFRPKTEKQLRKIIINSQKFKIPVTFASGKTGLSGGYVNFAIIVDLDDLHSFAEPFVIDLKNKLIKVEQAALISDLIKWIQYFSKGKLIFPVQPTSALRLPVRVGGLISTNASGLTSGKLGAAEDWVEKMRVLRPNGAIVEIDKSDALFKKIIGGNGFYGVILSAIFKLYEPLQNLTQAILFGDDISSVSNGLFSVLEAKVFPLFSELVLSPSGLSGRFKSIEDLNKNNQKIKWIVLIKGSSDIIEDFIKLMSKNIELLSYHELTEVKFQECLQERSSIPLSTVSTNGSTDFLRLPGFEDNLINPKDLAAVLATINEVLVKHGFNPILISNGHVNFRKGKGLLLHVRLPVPVEYFYKDNQLQLKLISETISEMISTLQTQYQIKYKAEHSPGPFQIWLDSQFRKSLRLDIESGEAFLNPHLMVFDELIKNKYGNEKILSKKIRKELFVSALYLYLSGS